MDPEILWPPPVAVPALARDEVHVWCMALDQPDERLAEWDVTLAPDERARAARFHFERDRRHFVAAHGLLRALLGRYLSTAPERVRFVYGPHGKPELDLADDRDERESTRRESTPAGPLRFNLAHAQALALVAVAPGHVLGVDLEQVRHLDDAGRVAERFFSPPERAALRALPPEQQAQGFFNAWTRKEAYLKACGDGLARPLHQFDVSLAPGEPAALLHVDGDEQEAARWSMQALTPASGYAGALAVAGHGWRSRCWRFM